MKRKWFSFTIKHLEDDRDEIDQWRTLTPSFSRQKSRCSKDVTQPHKDNQVSTNIKLITLILASRPPLNWSKTLNSHAFRQVDNMEVIDGISGRYAQTFSIMV